MRLAQLVDLESQLMRDEASLRAGEGKQLLARDQAIGKVILTELDLDAVDARNRLATKLPFRRAIGLSWLGKIEGRVPSLPGARLEAGYRLVGWGLVLVGLSLGFGTAKAVLAYDGTRPVNAFYFLAIFVVLQVFLLFLMVLAMATRSALGGHRLVGWTEAQSLA